MNNTIPKGWVRAAALQVNTAPSPYITEPGVVAAVTPYHTTPPGSAPVLTFTDVTEYNLWFRWWFDAPLPNPNPSFTVKDWGVPPAPAPAVWDKSKPHSQRPQAAPKAANPFDQPKPSNPFNTPKKPLNPFDVRK